VKLLGLLSLAVAPSLVLAASTAGGPVFVENKGQWDVQAKYRASANGMDMWLTDEGMVFDYKRFTPESNDPLLDRRPRAGTLKGQVVRMSFENAKPTSMVAANRAPGEYNFLIGNDQTRWATGARAYTHVVSEQPYDGVAVDYSFESGSPRYDIVITPGADPSSIGLRIDGASGVDTLANGSVRLHTVLGEIETRGLNAYQKVGGKLQTVPCRMVLDGNVIRFDVGAYDTSRDLVIDPLLYSTYIGGSSSSDYVQAVTTDAAKNIYATGSTYSTNFPISSGPYQRTNKAGTGGTAFVTKMNQAESALIFSTYLGGSVSDYAQGIGLDSSDNVTISGQTSSPDFPLTASAFQKTNGSLFVSKLSANGESLLFSTFAGGSLNLQYGVSMTDPHGNTILVGLTRSTTLSVSTNAFQKTNDDTVNSTGFVVSVNSTGTAQNFATYLGGTTGFVTPVAVAEDSGGKVAVAGYLSATDFPVTSTAFQKTLTSLHGGYNAFVTVLNSTGSAEVFSTYLGGTGRERIYGLGFNSSDEVVAGGYTTSSDFPTTAGAYQRTNKALGNSASDCFAAVFNTTGSALEASTLFGGAGGQNGNGDFVECMAFDSSGDLVFGGTAYSADYPTTSGAFETSGVDTNGTGFISVLNPTCTTLKYSTLLGDTVDGGSSCFSIAMNAIGDAVVGGYSGHSGFPVTSGAFNTSYAGGFVSSLSLVPGSVELASLGAFPLSSVGGSVTPVTVSLSNSSPIAEKVTLSGPATLTIPSSVSFEAGQTAVQFNATSKGVAANTSATITGTFGSLSRSVTLTILPGALSGMTVTSSPVVGGTVGSATLQFTGLLGAATTCSITSSNTTAIPSPGNVTAAAQTSSKSFNFTAAPVSANTTVTLTAHSGTQTATAMVVVAIPAISTFTLSSNTIVGGLNVVGAVKLAGAAGPSGDAAEVTSSSPDAVVSGVVKFGAGSTATSYFTIETKAVTASVEATITVKFGTSVKTQVLEINP
jgi:hypothetical protein